MKHFTLITEGIGVSPILRELEGCEHLWNQHSARTTAPGTPHRTSSDLWLRYNDVTPYERGERPWSTFNDEHVPIFYPAWALLPSLHPIVSLLMRMTDTNRLGGILITKIPPGCGIDRHADSSWHVDVHRKLYLSLKSVPGAVFGCEHDGVREELNPEPGQVWEFDNHKPHWVVNASTIDRITCIICVRNEEI